MSFKFKYCSYQVYKFGPVYCRHLQIPEHTIYWYWYFQVYLMYRNDEMPMFATAMAMNMKPRKELSWRTL